ncbi:MAG: GrpB family protein [Clostridiales bacterium]|nr:GrpB family protein [Clostridiales bacterium]
MGKPLSAMTLEELWQLFPIVLAEPQSCWKEWYAEESALLRRLLPAGTLISHIGSTAIDGIWAKPIVDILAEVPGGMDLVVAGAKLPEGGYRCMSRSDTRCSYNKGYMENGFAQRVFHLHLRFVGDHDELYFRDYLNDHPAIAKEYERLKLNLWKEYEHDRDGYTAAKAAFVARYTQEAKQQYGSCYEAATQQKEQV